MSAVMHAARVNRMYMSATTNACNTGSSSLVVETAESMITAKLKVVEERHHQGLYGVDLGGSLAQRDTSTKMKKSQRTCY
jgi:hypothetical protein